MYTADEIPPQGCEQNFWIEQDRVNLFIIPGVVSCFSCALDANGMNQVVWQIEGMDGNLVPVSLSTSNITAVGNFLVIWMPDSYVLPGTAGRQTIACVHDINGQQLEAILASPSKI